MEILQRLNKAYPVADDEQQRNLQDCLGATNKRIVGSAIEAMATGDMARLGELMVEAQAAFDAHAMPMCPNQLTAPNLHRVLNLAGLAPHIWGAKGVGSQGDGCAQLLCRSAADQEAAIQLVTRELGMPCMPLQIGSTRPVTQAVIPAASFPQNLFPASKSLPPALFPVLDADGILKPAILLLVEEAFEAGLQVTGCHSAAVRRAILRNPLDAAPSPLLLQHIVVIVSPQHKEAFEEIFHNQLDIRDFNRLPPRLRQYAAQLRRNSAQFSDAASLYSGTPRRSTRRAPR